MKPENVEVAITALHGIVCALADIGFTDAEIRKIFSAKPLAAAIKIARSKTK